jgi:hypothetical protein
MAGFCIGYYGFHYGYNGYGYGRLADAVAHADLMRSRPTRHDAGSPLRHCKAFAAPTDAEQRLMAGWPSSSPTRQSRH